LTCAFLSADRVSISNPATGAYAYIGKDNAIATTLSLSAYALGHIRIDTSIETHETIVKDASINGMFQPYEAYFRLGAAIYTKNIEVGILHECDHGIETAGRPEPFLGGGFTSIYVKLSGETTF
jgi:hypothetical protein